MRKYLLPETGSFYKANLHCHTVISDGRRTPEEVKALYKGGGYSVVAFTDHNVMIPHPDLRDPNFLPLTGYELNINSPGYPAKDAKTCHACFISLYDPDRPQPVMIRKNLKKATLYWADFVKLAPDAESFTPVYDPQYINPMLRAGRDSGFFVTYNHPVWSQENFGDYMNYHGMNAMEICNYGCACMGFDEYNGREYSDMLNGGERIFCIATDDNHNKHADRTPDSDSFGGWTVIKADRLDYESVSAALEAGNFYASTGPEIYSLIFEDGKVSVTCSDAQTVSCITGVRTARRAPGDSWRIINGAEFDIPAESRWFRIEVKGPDGHCAYTNAYFTDTLPY